MDFTDYIIIPKELMTYGAGKFIGKSTEFFTAMYL